MEKRSDFAWARLPDVERDRLLDLWVRDLTPVPAMEAFFETTREVLYSHIHRRVPKLGNLWHQCPKTSLKPVRPHATDEYPPFQCNSHTRTRRSRRDE